MHRTTLSPVELQALDELFDYRLFVEPRLAARAAHRRSAGAVARLEQVCDLELHFLVAREAGNLLLEDHLYATLIAAGSLAGCEHAGPGDPATTEHLAVIDAIRDGDAGSAEAAMTTHLTNALLRITDAVGRR